MGKSEVIPCNPLMEPEADWNNARSECGWYFEGTCRLYSTYYQLLQQQVELLGEMLGEKAGLLDPFRAGFPPPPQRCYGRTRINLPYLFGLSQQFIGALTCSPPPLQLLLVIDERHPQTLPVWRT